MSNGIGIRLDSDQLFLAVIEQDALIYLQCLSCLNPESVFREIHSLFSSRGWHRYTVAVSFSSRYCISRKFSVEFTELSDIEKIIQYTSEQYIHSLPIESLVVDYHILERKNHSTRLFSVAAPHFLIKKTLDFMASCHLDPFIVDMDLMGLFYLALLDTNACSMPLVLFLEIQPHSFHFLILKNGLLKDIRSVPLCTASFFPLSDTTEISADTLQILPDRFFLSPKNKKKLYSKITTELKRSLLGLSSIDKIYLSGHPNFVAEFPAYLQENASLSCEPWDISSFLHINRLVDKHVLPEFFPAIGLALKASGTTNLGLNFRKKDFRYQNAKEIIMKPLLIFLSLFFFLNLLFCFYLKNSYCQYQKKYELLILKAKESLERNFSDQTFSSSYWMQISDIRLFLEDCLHNPKNQTPPFFDTLSTWKKALEIISSLRQDHFFTINYFSIDQQRLSIGGLTESDLIFDLLKLKFSSSFQCEADSFQILVNENLSSYPNPRLKRRYKYELSINSPDIIYPTPGKKQ